MIREHIDVLDLEVLLVGQSAQAGENAKLLKKALVQHHDPEWNRPARKRMKQRGAIKGK